MEERVKKAISDLIGIPLESIQLDSRFRGDLEADSLDLVEIVIALEKEFDVSIPDEDAGSFEKVGDITGWLRAHCKGCDTCQNWDC